MQKLSRTQYGLEEQIMEAIFQLRQKKNSQLFRQPVDPKLLPDYYQKISYPMDLQTILNKLKQGKYKKADEVLKDLQQITTNCHTYNIQPAIIKKAQKFEECIKTEWGNFKKEIKKKNIDYNQDISHSQQIKQRLIILQEKKKKKRINIIQLNLMEDNKKSMPEISFLPPLNNDPLFFQERVEGKFDLPPHLIYKPQHYTNLSLQQKKSRLTFDFEFEDIEVQFERMAERKLAKYRKILFKKVMWLEEKIIQKCLQKKRFKKMLIPNHLSNLIDRGDIAKTLQIRKLQMYVKQITYWIQQYSHILNDYMKDKFVETCKCIRRCILRVLRYKKIQKTTKISLQSNIIQGQQDQQSLGEKMTQEEEMKNYQNRMKQFRRMVMRDIGESTKRDTKIIIKNDGGQFVVVDWNSENAEKRKRPANAWKGGILTYDLGADAQEVKNSQQRKQQMKKDEEFISQYKNKSNMEIILKYQHRLEFDWDSLMLKKIQSQQNILFLFDDCKKNQDQQQFSKLVHTSFADIDEFND